MNLEGSDRIASIASVTLMPDMRSKGGVGSLEANVTDFLELTINGIDKGPSYSGADEKTESHKNS